MPNVRASIGATLHGVVVGKLPCQEEGQSSDTCEAVQDVGMDCCIKCCFEEAFHRQDDRDSGKTREWKVANGKPPVIDVSVEVRADDEGLDAIVLYDASSRPRLVVENIQGKLTIHVWENADEDTPTTAITLE